MDKSNSAAAENTTTEGTISLVSITRHKKFVFLVRFMYLVAFGLIGTGIYVDYLHDQAVLGDQAEDTDYDNVDIGESTGGEISLVPLTLDEVQELINNVNPSDRAIFNNINSLLDIADNIRDTDVYHIDSDKQTLAGALTKLLKEKDPNVKLNMDDVNTLQKLSTDLRHLSQGQRLAVNFGKTGNILYLSWFENPKIEKRFIRVGNSYFTDIKVNKSDYRYDVLSLGKIGTKPSNTLQKMGVSVEAALGISHSFEWQLAKEGQKIDRNARITVVSSREYVGEDLVSPTIYRTIAAKLTQGNKTYYSIFYNGTWYDQDGFHQTQVTFRRYPFAFKPIITSPFNLHRLNPVTGRISPHYGVDFGVPKGTPILSPADGRVLKVAYQANGAGNYLVIQHDSTYKTVYMHLTKALVKEGEKVKQGEKVALSGNTGRSTGPHLHYEVRINNKPYNPITVPLPTKSSPNLNTNQRFLSFAKHYVSVLNGKN